ncbi:MAG: CHAP domain-containing protein [Candidatus Nomurabacteria bacterium]|jgi:surface antigen|nr:CHAP domain-containing protein [Candidatus Nomurabacteria bacterium]
MKIARKIGIILSAAVFTASTAFVAAPNQSVAAADYLCVSVRCKQAAADEAKARSDQEKAAAEKGSYQAEVNRLAAEVSAIQAEIRKNEEEIVELSNRIDNTAKKIERLKESLKKAIVKIYLNNDVSEFEILASSNSVVDFTTKTTNQEIIQGKVKQLAAEAKAAKEELERQKTEVEGRKANNELDRARVATKQSEQQTFVNEWKGREDAYADAADGSKAIKEEEMEKQRQIIQSQQGGGGYSGDPSKGGYPFADQCPWNGDGFDHKWGYVCECVSYAGWKVYERTNGVVDPNFWGNASNWYGRYGTVGAGTSPQPNSVAVTTAGYYGHVAWVEWLNPNGTIHISQYNAVRFQYSEADVSPSAFEWYMYY